MREACEETVIGDEPVIFRNVIDSGICSIGVVIKMSYLCVSTGQSPPDTSAALQGKQSDSFGTPCARRETILNPVREARDTLKPRARGE